MATVTITVVAPPKEDRLNVIHTSLAQLKAHGLYMHVYGYWPIIIKLLATTKTRKLLNLTAENKHRVHIDLFNMIVGQWRNVCRAPLHQFNIIQQQPHHVPMQIMWN